MVMFLINAVIAIFFLYWVWIKWVSFDKKRDLGVALTEKLSKNDLYNLVQEYKKEYDLKDLSKKTRKINEFIKGRNE